MVATARPYTHTGRQRNVGYEHRGRLFGHDLPTRGVVRVHPLAACEMVLRSAASRRAVERGEL